ncbi:hypothetical protein FHR81_004753 [Actinoalloteichus hoggarensis]|uniref:Putative sugar phosphate isomerase YwlF n=1 Tax=Actinoalloteichus hoggarensis TaxID=1470176 RepID=A0A221W4R0_9PSEU|nr:Putative sugar phosphate isomerase YwlF [Actinoalloteichus hoggarensis]MBB5923682.1 hypothetical protein [Actinoalloteichus hoggarensis]
MRIALGDDHAGHPLKNHVASVLRRLGHEIVDHGTSDDAPVDFPDITFATCDAMRRGETDRAVLVSGTGVGAVMAASKIAGNRCALGHDAYSAHLIGRPAASIAGFGPFIAVLRENRFGWGGPAGFYLFVTAVGIVGVLATRATCDSARRAEVDAFITGKPRPRRRFITGKPRPRRRARESDTGGPSTGGTGAPPRRPRSPGGQSVPNSIAARSRISSSPETVPREAMASAPPRGIAPISPVAAAWAAPVSAG